MPFKKGNKINKGRTPWNKGKPWPKETRDKMSRIAKELGIGKSNKGKKRTASMKKRLSESKKGKKNPKNSGENHPNWKGGRKFNVGYIMVKKPNHPFCRKDGYIHEHRLIMEKYIGRYLTKVEVVHHINKDTTDNRIENLKLFKNNSEHIKFHRSSGEK